MNTMTDALKLVQREEGKGAFAWLSRKQSERFGFCLVIFRRDAFLGFISSSDIVVASDVQRRYLRLGVRDGDTILAVNLGPKPLEITDTLPTSDRWPRAYQLMLEIQVTDPVKFAQLYIQESDPVALAKTAIEGYIQRCTSVLEHDEISERMLRDYAEQALKAEPNASIGLGVNIAHKATLSMNPLREREITAERERAERERAIQYKGIFDREQARQDIDTRTVQAQGDIELEGIRNDARRLQEQREARHLRDEEERGREHKRQLEKGKFA